MTRLGKVKRRVALLAAVLLAALAPRAAEAHVKWFEDSGKYPLQSDLVLSSRTALFLAVAAGALLGLYALQRLLGSPHWPEIAFLRQMALGAPTLLAIQAAIGLVHAAVQPVLFAPNLPLARNAGGFLLAGLQIAIAFTFITGLADWAGAIALILLVPLAFFFFAPFDVLEQFFWVGIGVVILVVGRFAPDSSKVRPWFQRRTRAWSARAIAILRVITGVAIVVPAFSEKLWNPGIGEAFLAHHPNFNFVQTYLGQAWCTNERFVLAAGIAEGVIGVLLISGLLTRVVILGMWVPFNLTVPFLPPAELLGHIPIFGIMYLLLVHSSGIAPGESFHRPAPPGTPGRKDQAHPPRSA